MSVQEPCYKTVKQPANEKALSKHKKIRGKKHHIACGYTEKGKEKSYREDKKAISVRYFNGVFSGNSN